MPNTCAAVGCKTNYLTCKEKVSTFSFPNEKEKPELFRLWVKFVNRESNWKPTSHTTLCAHHFDENYMKRGKVRIHLKWDMNPIPTIHTDEVLKRPSTIPTPEVPRKAPKLRVYQEDQMKKFLENDVISCFEDIDEQHSPRGYQFMKRDDCVIYYKLVFDEITSFPKVFASIRIDTYFHVQLQCNGNPLPLPLWFIQGTNAKLRRFSALDNFPKEFENAAANDPYQLIDELEKRRNYNPKGRPPYSNALIRYALLLRYTSLQAYKLLLEKFPMPSISLLNKLKAGGVDAMKSVKYLLEKGEISRDVVLMFDEMYLQKCTQFHGGKYEGADEEGNHYKGIVVFMIAGLKKSIPFVVKASPETFINGEWLEEEIEKVITSITASGFNIRGLVADNHSSNVKAFNILLTKFETDSTSLFISHPANESRIYIFYDKVHLLKNVRNNLFNAKNLFFQVFTSC